jgi:hypothetical protein
MVVYLVHSLSGKSSSILWSRAECPMTVFQEGLFLISLLLRNNLILASKKSPAMPRRKNPGTRAKSLVETARSTPSASNVSLMAEAISFQLQMS